MVSVYFLIPPKYRWGLLLIAGFYFYLKTEPLYLVVLLVSILIDYVCAIRMGKTGNQRERKYYLILSLFCNLGLLLVFKYLSFFDSALKDFLQIFSVSYRASFLNIAAPLGISYYTFKKISYVIDVYREHQEPETHLGIFALYVSFFPQVTAGPIDRGRDLLSQFRQAHRFEYSQVVGGLKLMTWGMFKKIVVADRLALVVNPVFDNPSGYEGGSLIIAVFFFSIQIYADFSGYSDIAIGMGRVMGFNLADNFNRPYFAVGITEFWRRWHITLTTWLRDYIFLPIAYSSSRKLKPLKLWKWSINVESRAYILSVICTMLLCGLWHGAAWTYVLWGGLHGIYLAVSFATRKARKRMRKKWIGKKWKRPYRVLRILFTFIMVTFLWIFFRAASMSDAAYIVSHLFTGLGDFPRILSDGEMLRNVVISLFAVGFLVFVHLFQPHDTVRNMFSRRPLLVRWLMYILLLLAIMNFGVFKDVPFIYTQF